MTVHVSCPSSAEGRYTNSPRPTGIRIIATIAVTLLVSLCVLYLNYWQESMNGVMPHYEDFRRIIAAGLNPAVAKLGHPTFPMWGYGFILTVTRERFPIIFVQTIVAVSVTVLSLRSLYRNRLISAQCYRFATAVMSVSLPWFAFHSMLTPYSFAISAFMASITLLLSSLVSPKHSLVKAVISGLLFGICLNFRSDFIFLPLVLCLLLSWAARFQRPALQRLTIFTLTLYATLLPWAQYSHRATGHYLLTSTNSGHVMFISLGNLPSNPWGIISSDTDPCMRETLRRHFGRDVSSLVYESQSVLTTAFLKNIEKEPIAFLKKTVYNAWFTLIRGVYPGEFWEAPRCKPNCFVLARDHVHELLKNPFRMALWQDPEMDLRLGVEAVSYLIGKALIILSMLTLPFTVRAAVTRRGLLETALCGCIAYQVTLQVLTYNMTLYMTNMYMLHVLNLSLVGPTIASRLRSVGRRAMSEKRR